MRIPMIVLAACSLLVGWIFVPIKWTAWSIMATSSIVALGGISLVWYFYVVDPEKRASIDERFATVTGLLRNRWYVDAAFEEHFVEGIVLRSAAGADYVDTSIVDGTVRGAAWVSRQIAAAFGWFDSAIIDGAVRSISTGARFLSWPSRALQTGFVQTYALFFLAGVVAALGYVLSR